MAQQELAGGRTVEELGGGLVAIYRADCHRTAA
jgi:hypothetical protein